MIKVVQAVPHHADIIKPKDIYLDNPRIREQTKVGIVSSDSFTLFSKEGEMLAIVGCLMLFDGVCEFWSLMSHSCEKYPITFFRKISAMIDVYASERKLRRVQMTVRKSHKQGLRWAAALGFEKEGVMRKYGPEGDDYVMFGRLL